MLRGAALLALMALPLASCAFPVEGTFLGKALPGGPLRRDTIVVIFNHGFAREKAGTYQVEVPPILQWARDRNPDVIVYAQVRNTARLDSVHHASYIESAVEFFNKRQGMPLENIILAGQSCGGWGSLQAAAFTYPGVGGVIAFAPTCHGKLPHSTEIRTRREQEIGQLARRATFRGVLFLYEGDSYYDIGEWDAFRAQLSRAPALRVETVSRDVVFRTCTRCATDSHGAVWDTKFAEVFFASHVQPFIERVRARIRARTAAAVPTATAAGQPTWPALA